MTTDKTPATLATAKHGGCVQVVPSDAARNFLAAQYRDDGDKAKAIRINHKSLTNSDRRAMCAIDAALSAQPSPGGQDALASELLAHAERLERMAAGDRETGLSIEQAIEDGEGYTPDEATDVAAGLQHDAERGEETAALLRKAAAALAARQPEVK